jgi:hypothetical protein
MGRRAKEFTDKELAQFEALASYLTLEQIADYFGIARKTLQNMRKRDDELDTIYKKARAIGFSKVGGAFMKNCLDGSVPAQIFYLKTQGGWRETDVKESAEPTPDLNISFSVKEPVGDIRITKGGD